MLNGNLDAAVGYAAMLENGETGIRNLETALQIYKEAAEKGHAGAMLAMGGMFEEGRGIPGDYRQAFLLYSTAGKLGVKEGTERLEKLKKRLTAEQIQAAEAFVANGARDAGTPPGSPAPGAAAKTDPATPAAPGKTTKPPAKPTRKKNR
jgi:TPR repeat protein